MATVDVLKAQIVRQDLAESWGFTLQGGSDTGEPLRMLTVTPRSPAARIGLKAGDMITEIGDQPTSNLTQQEALDTLAQYGLSLILTVERKARGSIPTNPVLHGPANAEPIKGYQTYNMASGNQRPVNQMSFFPCSPPCSSPSDSRRSFSPSFTYPKPPQPWQPARPAIYQTYDLNGPRAPSPTTPKHDYRFETVKARPFEVPPTKSVPSAYTNPPPVYQSQQVDYDQLDSPGAQTQSRTFKILQGLMENEEPRAGVFGLPPPRSAAYEKMKEEQANKFPTARVRVFMPQSYNCPVGLYSPQNVVHTFQDQAEQVIGAMESQDQAGDGALPDGDDL